MSFHRWRTALGLAAALLVAGPAQAEDLSYPNGGSRNPDTYTFTATTTGDIGIYLVDWKGIFEKSLGVIVNGVDQGIQVGYDSNTIPPQTGSLLFNIAANIGDSIVFYLDVPATFTRYSNAFLNADGESYTYSTPFAGGDVDGVIYDPTFYSPDTDPDPDVDNSYSGQDNSYTATFLAGIYVAFEDWTFDGDFRDVSFIMTNLSVAAVPAPGQVAGAGLPMLLGGAAWLIARRRKAVA